MFSKNDELMKSLAIRLFEINAFKFGDFKMKVGINSPVYFDLRVIISFPDVMKTLSGLLVEFMKEININCDHVCGVPYTALPIATIISIQNSIPMLIRRKEAKGYGTKKLIEGKFKSGDNCLIIEDVVTSGSSILDTVRDLRNEGITVTDAIVVVDREQGGSNNIAEKSVRMHSLFKLSHLLNILQEASKIERKTVESVAKYIKGCQIKGDGSFATDKKIVNELVRTRMTFSSRAELSKCQSAKDLFKLMTDKSTNLCLAADLNKSEDILNLAEICGPYICVLKTHCDIIEDYNENFIKSLQSIAKVHKFMIMEDRKFADIGNTVAQQYSSGLYKISEWSDLVTVHSISGPSIIQSLKLSQSNQDKRRACFLLAEMSSQGNLINEKYMEATIKLATESADVDFIAGIVCQNSDCFGFPGLIQLTPGVKIDDVGDNLGQKYQTPEYVVKEKGADIAVVGRGIFESKSIEKTAALYRDRLWTAYCERVGIN